MFEKIMTKEKNNKMISNTLPDVSSKKKAGKLNQLLSKLTFGFGNNQSVISVIRLEGVIGKSGMMKSSLNLGGLNNIIEKAFKFDKLEAVCLIINSPGGSPVQSELIASRIMNLAKEKAVPVYSFVEDVAASGGYWLACAGSRIYATRSSILGSIGVISSGFGFQDLIKKIGVERRVYTEGDTKSVLDPFQPAKKTDIEIIKKLQKEIHEHFISHVKKQRGNRLTQTDNILFNGQFWSGQIALDYGLIDGINDLYSFIKQHYGDDVKIEYVDNKQSWLKKKLGLTKISKIFAQDVAESVSNNIEEKILYNKFNIN